MDRLKRLYAIAQNAKYAKKFTWYSAFSKEYNAFLDEFTPTVVMSLLNEIESLNYTLQRIPEDTVELAERLEIAERALAEVARQLDDTAEDLNRYFDPEGGEDDQAEAKDEGKEEAEEEDGKAT
jgi:hypothetical protein